jgi:hypothetical protein
MLPLPGELHDMFDEANRRADAERKGRLAAERALAELQARIEGKEK